MAKVIPTALIAGLKGSLEGSTFKGTKRGTIIRRRLPPRQPRTASQQAIRGQINKLAGMWYDLEEPKKELWNKYGSLLSEPTSGFNVFCGLNARLLTAGHSELTYKDAPPPMPVTPAPPDGVTITKIDSSNIQISWDSTIPLSYIAWPPREGTVLWLDLNEGTGTLTKDRSGYNNHGTIYGATWTTSPFSYALRFDGTDDYVEVADDVSIRFNSGNWTVECWAKADWQNFPNDKYLWAKSEQANRFMLSYQPNRWRIESNEDDAGSVDLLFNDTLSSNTWVYTAVAKQGDQYTVYRDGVSKGTKTGYADPSNNQPFLIAKNPWWPPGYFPGPVAGVRVLSRALSDTEIDQDYNFPYVQIFAAPQSVYDSTNKEKWTHIATVRADSGPYTYTHSWPEGTILSFRLRTIERWGRVSPWTEVRRIAA